MIILNENYSSAQDWDAFVEGHPEARYCQLYHYSDAAAAYGFDARHLCFLKNEDIVGVLPAVRVTSLLFGRKLVSQPFSEYGGLLIAPDLTNDEIGHIIQLLKQVLLRYDIPCIEMHGCNGVSEENCSKYFSRRNPHQYAYLKLDRPIEELWRNVVRYEVRKAVSKAQRSNIIVEEQCDQENISRAFFPLYLQSMKRLGAPPHSLEYYIRCCQFFPHKMKIFWARRNGALIAALVGFTCGKRVNIVSTVSDPAFWDYRPNDLLHWEFIKWARDEGYEYFDFGSVRYKGQLRYKEKWGCTIRNHAYYFLTANDALPMRVTFDSSSRLMKAFANIWSTCVPLRLTQMAGPVIRKHLVR